MGPVCQVSSSPVVSERHTHRLPHSSAWMCVCMLGGGGNHCSFEKNDPAEPRANSYSSPNHQRARSPPLQGRIPKEAKGRSPPRNQRLREPWGRGGGGSCGSSEAGDFEKFTSREAARYPSEKPAPPDVRDPPSVLPPSRVTSVGT